MSRNDGDALRFVKQIMRDPFIGGVHDLFEDLGGFMRPGNVILAV